MALYFVVGGIAVAFGGTLVYIDKQTVKRINVELPKLETFRSDAATQASTASVDRYFPIRYSE